MKKVILYCLSLLFMAGCTGEKKIIGGYYSSCVLYERPDLVLIIEEDSTFYYEIPFVKEEVKGTWVLIKDSLILSSPAFEIKRERLTPMLKHTEAEKRDVYLVRKKKLFRKAKEGFSKSCYLLRVK
ncbi:MAG: hypothetical protein ACFB0B_17500 [Thermonemataceae bacterium]